jgi:hypothetical protein
VAKKERQRIELMQHNILIICNVAEGKKLAEGLEATPEYHVDLAVTIEEAIALLSKNGPYSAVLLGYCAVEYAKRESVHHLWTLLGSNLVIPMQATEEPFSVIAGRLNEKLNRLEAVQRTMEDNQAIADMRRQLNEHISKIALMA